MKWIKATERLPKLETIVCVRLVAGLKLGNFYADENGKKFFHVSAQDSVADWEIPEYLFYDIDWLDEGDDWFSVEVPVEKKHGCFQLIWGRDPDFTTPDIYIAYLGDDNESWFYRDIAFVDVTHWQPLPSAPQGGDNKIK